MRADLGNRGRRVITQKTTKSGDVFLMYTHEPAQSATSTSDHGHEVSTNLLIRNHLGIDHPRPTGGATCTHINRLESEPTSGSQRMETDTTAA